MKRSILFALIAVVALTTAFGAGAAATPGGDSQATAAAKKKGCKKKKGKGKAKGSATASAGKKKGKGKGCKKGKGKGGDKGSPGGKTPPPPPPPPSNWPPADGGYEDSAGLSFALDLSNNAGTASVAFSGNDTCVPLILPGDPVPTTVTATTLSASGSFDRPVVGLALKYSWKLTVNTDLTYELITDSSIDPGIETKGCDKPGVVFKGTLKKSVTP